MVLISSAMATLGGPGEYVMYATSKGAVESLSIGLSREVAAEGIRVNVVEPGPIATGIHPPGRLERLTKAMPMARPGTPEEIAQAVMFLLVGAVVVHHRRGAAGGRGTVRSRARRDAGDGGAGSPHWDRFVPSSVKTSDCWKRMASAVASAQPGSALPSIR